MKFGPLIRKSQALKIKAKTVADNSEDISGFSSFPHCAQLFEINSVAQICFIFHKLDKLKVPEPQPQTVYMYSFICSVTAQNKVRCPTHPAWP